MNHVKAFAIKFISSFVLLYIILGMFYEMSFGDVFLISLVLSVAAYIIGDLVVLPRTNNMVATIVDFGLAMMVIWLFVENLTAYENTFTMSLIASLGVALFEYMFHKYVSSNVISQSTNEENRTTNLTYQTEASEELSPDSKDVKSDDLNEL